MSIVSSSSETNQLTIVANIRRQDPLSSEQAEQMRCAYTSQCYPATYQDVLNFGCTLHFHYLEPESWQPPPSWGKNETD